MAIEVKERRVTKPLSVTRAYDLMDELVNRAYAEKDLEISRGLMMDAMKYAKATIVACALDQKQVPALVTRYGITLANRGDELLIFAKYSLLKEANKGPRDEYNNINTLLGIQPGGPNYHPNHY